MVECDTNSTLAKGEDVRKYRTADMKQKVCSVILDIKAVNQPCKQKQMLKGGWLPDPKGESATQLTRQCRTYSWFWFLSASTTSFSTPFVLQKLWQA